MKLLTHNMLASHVKGVSETFPLGIEVEKVKRRGETAPRSLLASRSRFSTRSLTLHQVETVEADFDAAFLRHILPRLDWPALVTGAAALGAEPPLPADPPTAEQLEDETFLRALHHALLEVCLAEGALICPGSGRRFPVVKGVPNMLLNDGE
jgi:multifunctional methyltransferase subunit TRM112